MEFKLLVDQLNKLNLPRDQYVVVGLGSMAAHGIREAEYDFDITVTPKLWEELTKKYEVQKEHGYEFINVGDLSFMGSGSMFDVPEIASTQEMVETAEIVEGHRFLNFDLLKKFKLKKAREKDIRDIELIDKYLNG